MASMSSIPAARIPEPEARPLSAVPSPEEIRKERFEKAQARIMEHFSESFRKLAADEP